MIYTFLFIEAPVCLIHTGRKNKYNYWIFVEIRCVQNFTTQFSEQIYG